MSTDPSDPLREYGDDWGPETEGPPERWDHSHQGPPEERRTWTRKQLDRHYLEMADARVERIRALTDRYLAIMTLVRAMQGIFSPPPVPRGFRR